MDSTSSTSSRAPYHDELEASLARERRRRILIILVTALLVAVLVLLSFYVYWFAETRWLIAFSLFALTSIPIGVQKLIQSNRRILELNVARYKREALRDIHEADFENLDRVTQLREEKAQVDFRGNLNDAFLIESLELDGVDFFGKCSWRLQAGVNILLGRNGYGKSLILRSVVALLQRNEEASKDLFVSASDQAFLQLSIQRNGVPELIRRDRRRFTESKGKIPILAIPDSRFVNRVDISIKAPKGNAVELRSEGATHFLESRPYGQMMDVLFNELCFDYLENRSSFDHPAFILIQRAIETLTGDEFHFHSVKRVARDEFHLLVRTEGNETPLPIQYASQGTLSVLGVVGIIRSYLSDLFPEARDEELLKKPAIVFIDELDAHLHPLWQQRLTGILRENFPNIQFVLSAHSPLVVAGCWSGEVAVLRKGTDGFDVEPMERDFIGTSVAEIYEVIFGVEDLDDSYLQSASRAASGFSNQERIEELEEKEANNEQTEIERREFSRLIREEGMIRRAAQVKVERQDDQKRIIELEAQVNALQDKLKGLGGANGGNR